MTISHKQQFSLTFRLAINLNLNWSDRWGMQPLGQRVWVSPMRCFFHASMLRCS